MRVVLNIFTGDFDFVDDGRAGPTGAPGQDGQDGPPGDDGPPGPQGQTGATGATGPQGPQGFQGVAGIPGADGQEGPEGAMGVPGVTGATGATGSQGIQGPIGIPGFEGDDGPEGPIGPTGLTGATGATGAQGIQGVMGIPGFDGSDGEDGLRGPPGTPGVTGANGLTIPGPQGDEGDEGWIGPVGLRGATGAVGPMGMPGFDGDDSGIEPLGLVASGSDNGLFLLLAGRSGVANNPVISLDGDGTITGSLVTGGRLFLTSGALSITGQGGIEVYPTAGTIGAVDVAAMNVVGTVTIGSFISAFNGLSVGLHRTWLVSADPLSASAFGSRCFVAGPNITSSGNRSDIGYHGSYMATGGFGAAAGETVSAGVGVAFHDLRFIGLANNVGTTTISALYSLWSQPAVFTGHTLTDRRGLLYANKGGGGTVGTSIAVDVATQTVSTLAVALRSAITDASTRYFLQDTGGARSFIKGQVRFGDTSDPTAQIDVVGKFLLTNAGLITTYNNIPVVGFGVPAIVDTQSLTTKVADIVDTAFVNAATAGDYLVTVYLVDTTGAIGAGAVTCNIKYNDGAAAQTVTVGPVALVTLGTFAQATIRIHLGSGSITYGTTHTGIFSTAAYALYATCKRVN